MYKTLIAAALATFSAGAAFAETYFGVHDAYAITSRPGAPTAAIFMELHNHGDADERLIAARTDAAQITELHTHIMEDGVARMVEIEGGIDLPLYGGHDFVRGGDHIMLMGVTERLEPGMSIDLTLIMESGAEFTISVPVVDQADAPKDSHGSHNH